MGGKRVKRIYDNEGNLISKECGKCHEIKPVSEFYKQKKVKDGLQSQCKECRNEHCRMKKPTIRNYDSEGNLISKECSCCHEIKPVSEFGKYGRAKDGLKSRCKKCRNENNKKYRQENPDKIKEKDKKYRQENPDKFKGYNKKYRQENPNYFKKYRQENPDYFKKYYQENPDKFKGYNKKFKQENPDYEKERYDKKVQEALQQNKKEIESNPKKYNYREGEEPHGIIYSVHNIKSNRYYVGQTTTTFDIRYPSGWLRKHGHKKEVKEDLELYGEESFEYNKLLDVAYSQYELDKLEAHYIDYYDSYENGYNETRGNIFTNRGKEK